MAGWVTYMRPCHRREYEPPDASGRFDDVRRYIGTSWYDRSMSRRSVSDGDRCDTTPDSALPGAHSVQPPVLFVVNDRSPSGSVIRTSGAPPGVSGATPSKSRPSSCCTRKPCPTTSWLSSL